MRLADVQVRIGSPKLDNTHGEYRSAAVNSQQLPLSDDREALMRSLWVATNTGYGNAIDNFLRVKTEAQVRAKEEDTSGDFTPQAAQVHIEKPAAPLSRRSRCCGSSACAHCRWSFVTIPMSTRTR